MANLISKIQNIFKKKEQETSQPEETRTDGTQPEEAKPEETKSEETKTSDDFEYAMKHLDGKDQDEVLKAITEKGTEGFRDSIRLDKKQQLENMRKAKAKEYAERFGGKYTQQDGAEEEKDEGR
ncbi:MAG: hypothetical protein ACI4U9_01340 [Clostridia bacterium]